MSVQDDLATLRAGAETRDWGTLQETLTRLFMELDFYTALDIAVTRAHAHLPVFEAALPDAVWARQFLVGLVAYGMAPAQLPPEMGQNYPVPGAANFIAGLLELARGAELKTPLENRLRFLASAVSHVLLADLAAFWYGQHPDAWALQQARGDEVNPATGQTIRQGIYAQFWLDPEVAARDSAGWRALAEAVEKKQY